MRDVENVFHVIMIVCTLAFLVYVIPYGRLGPSGLSYIITASTIIFTAVILLKHLNK